MPPTAVPSSPSDAPHSAFAELPLDEPVSDMADAVRGLKNCPADELRQARKRHRRAVQALRNGAYDALADETRQHLLKRLHANLEVLNRALTKELDSERSDAPSGAQSQSASEASFSPFRLSEMVTWFW